MSEIRQRKTSSSPLESFRELDAFQKLPEEIEQKSEIGNKKKIFGIFRIKGIKIFFRWHDVNFVTPIDSTRNL